MQLLSHATNSSIHAAAHEVVIGVPPVIWFIREQMRPHRKGLSLPQFRALVLIDRNPEASLSEIAEQCSASLPTTSRLIAGLVAKGLVTRKGCSDDRRQLELAITRLGRDMLDTAWAAVQKRVEDELQPLTDAQRKTIHHAMRLLQGVFGSLELPDRQNSRECQDSVKNHKNHKETSRALAATASKSKPFTRASK
jgi:DNA-binding MarR family transcriptional regulator